MIITSVKDSGTVNLQWQKSLTRWPERGTVGIGNKPLPILTTRREGTPTGPGNTAVGLVTRTILACRHIWLTWDQRKYFAGEAVTKSDEHGG